MNADAPVSIVNQSETLPEFAPKYLQGFLELFPDIHQVKEYSISAYNGLFSPLDIIYTKVSNVKLIDIFALYITCTSRYHRYKGVEKLNSSICFSILIY